MSRKVSECFIRGYTSDITSMLSLALVYMNQAHGHMNIILCCDMHLWLELIFNFIAYAWITWQASANSDGLFGVVFMMGYWTTHTCSNEQEKITHMPSLFPFVWLHINDHLAWSKHPFVYAWLYRWFHFFILDRYWHQFALVLPCHGQMESWPQVSWLTTIATLPMSSWILIFRPKTLYFCSEFEVVDKKTYDELENQSSCYDD